MAGTLTIIWMTLSLPSFVTTVQSVFPSFQLPKLLVAHKFPWHEFMIPVLGTAVVVLVGVIVGFLSRRPVGPTDSS